MKPRPLYQLIHLKIARRASARVAKTRPWRHSRLRLSQNDSATALSQHTPVRPTEGRIWRSLAVVDVVVGRVLAAPVGVGDDAGDGAVATSGGDRHLQGVEDELGAHVVGHRVAQQPPRPEVEDRRQVQPALPGRDVGDVLAPGDIGRPGREPPARRGRGCGSRRARGTWCGTSGAGTGRPCRGSASGG